VWWRVTPIITPVRLTQIIKTHASTMLIPISSIDYLQPLSSDMRSSDVDQDDVISLL
jgi:hypothetical protein